MGLKVNFQSEIINEQMFRQNIYTVSNYFLMIGTISFLEF